MFIHIITFISLFALARAGYMSDSLNGWVPTQCQADCAPVISSLSCLDSQGVLGWSVDTATGSSSIQGNKLDLYLCVCSSAAQAQSATCLSCISTSKCINPPLTSDHYNQLCSGSLSLSDIITSMHFGC